MGQLYRVSVRLSNVAAPSPTPDSHTPPMAAPGAPPIGRVTTAAQTPTTATPETPPMEPEGQSDTPPEDATEATYSYRSDYNFLAFNSWDFEISTYSPYRNYRIAIATFYGG